MKIYKNLLKTKACKKEAETTEQKNRDGERKECQIKHKFPLDCDWGWKIMPNWLLLTQQPLKYTFIKAKQYARK